MAMVTKQKQCLSDILGGSLEFLTFYKLFAIFHVLIESANPTGGFFLAGNGMLCMLNFCKGNYRVLPLAVVIYEAYIFTYKYGNT